MGQAEPRLSGGGQRPCVRARSVNSDRVLTRAALIKTVRSPTLGVASSHRLSEFRPGRKRGRTERKPDSLFHSLLADQQPDV